jgi:hypothetical protein
MGDVLPYRKNSPGLHIIEFVLAGTRFHYDKPVIPVGGPRRPLRFVDLVTVVTPIFGLVRTDSRRQHDEQNDKDRRSG